MEWRNDFSGFFMRVFVVEGKNVSFIREATLVRQTALP
jgi:hypothetical protein